MPPIDMKEWWIAAAAATSLIAPTAEAAPRPGETVGVVSAVHPKASSSITEKIVYAGENVTFGERFTTDSSGVLHVLFMDQSSITLGPNTEVTIDQFAYDPEKREGNLAINLLKGALRVVGGFISKKNSTKISTTTATIGIRGGISLVESQAQQTQAIFLFGQQMQISPTEGGSTHTITRPGFGVSVQGNTLGTPFLVPPSLLQSLSQIFVTPVNPGSPTPSGQNLVSTNDRPTGTDTPGVTLANDRTQTVTNTINTASPQNSIRNLLGSSPSTNQS